MQERAAWESDQATSQAGVVELTGRDASINREEAIGGVEMAAVAPQTSTPRDIAATGGQ